MTVRTSEAVCEATETYRGEEIDGEPGVPRVLPREQPAEHVLHVGVAESISEHC